MAKHKGRSLGENWSQSDQGRTMRQQRTSTPSHRGGRGGGNRK
jgi:hypothetical protein